MGDERTEKPKGTLSQPRDQGWETAFGILRLEEQREGGASQSQGHLQRLGAQQSHGGDAAPPEDASQRKVGELGIEIPRPLLAYPPITPQCLRLVTQTQKPKSKEAWEMSFPASLTKDREEI